MIEINKSSYSDDSMLEIELRLEFNKKVNIFTFFVNKFFFFSVSSVLY